MSSGVGWRGSSHIVVIVVIVGCGSHGPAPTTLGSTADQSERAPATAALVVGGPVSWNLLQALRIDERGEVFGGEGDSSRMGVLTPTGDFVVDGEIAARLAPDGTVEVGGEVSSYRVVGMAVLDTSPAPGDASPEPVMRLEGDELVFPMDGRAERLVITGLRAELTREVLFLSAVMLIGATHSH